MNLKAFTYSKIMWKTGTLHSRTGDMSDWLNPGLISLPPFTLTSSVSFCSFHAPFHSQWKGFALLKLFTSIKSLPPKGRCSLSCISEKNCTLWNSLFYAPINGTRALFTLYSVLMHTASSFIVNQITAPSRSAMSTQIAVFHIAFHMRTLVWRCQELNQHVWHALESGPWMLCLQSMYSAAELHTHHNA